MFPIEVSSKRSYKIIGIVGSRRRCSEEDRSALFNQFTRLYKEGDRIISGGCSQGGDFFAEEIAKRRGIPIIIHHAAWSKLGRGAGIIRNTKIAEECDILIALVASDRTGGTEDTIKKALKLEKSVIII